MGWSFPLISNIPQHLQQATCGLVPVASQLQSAGSSGGLAVSKARGLNLTLPYYQAAPSKLVASTSSRNHSNHSLGGGISCIQPKTDKLS